MESRLSLRLPPKKTQKEIDEEEAKSRRAEAVWWKENKTMQRLLIKPRYESSKAFSSKMRMLTKENFNFEVIYYLRNLCMDIDRGKHSHLPKSEMPGFAVGSVKEDFDSTPVKGDNFIKTSILVLDIDEVPSTVNNVGLWLVSILPEHVYAFWYSTPRWTDAQKRIRIVIPMTKEISMEEKKSMSTRLNIPGVDQASFEAGKFSLLPCWCQETTDFVWGEVGRRYLDPDKDLPPWIPERPREQVPTIRLEALAKIATVLVDIVEKINDAPDGGSQEVIKSNLSKAFRKYAIKYEHCEAYAQFIYRADRAKDFLGIARWLENRYRR